MRGGGRGRGRGKKVTCFRSALLARLQLLILAVQQVHLLCLLLNLKRPLLQIRLHPIRHSDNMLVTALNSILVAMLEAGQSKQNSRRSMLVLRCKHYKAYCNSVKRRDASCHNLQSAFYIAA